MTENPPAPASSTAATRDWLSALARVVERVRVDAGHGDILQRLAQGMVDLFGVALARFWQYDPATHTLNQRTAAGLDGELPGSLIELANPDTGSPIVRAVAERRAIVIHPIEDSHGFNAAEWLAANGLVAYAGYPLVVDSRLAGAMAIFLREPPPAALLDALGIIAQQAALVLEHARIIEESHTLQTIAAELASARDTEPLLEQLVERTMTALGADACAVWIHDVEHDRLRSGAARGLSGHFLEIMNAGARPDNTPTFNQLRLDPRPIFATNVARRLHLASPDAAAMMELEGVVSGLWLPLFGAGREVTGMLALYHRRERLYSDSEVRLAQAFTNQIAVAMQNARLAEQEHAAREVAAHQLERIHALSQITEQLLGSVEVDDVLDVVVTAAERLSSAAMAMVALADPDRRHVTAVAVAGPLRQLLGRIPERQEMTESYLNGTATGRAFATGATVTVEDYTQWPPAAEAQTASVAAGAQSVIAAPLRLGAAVIGVLWVGGDKPHAFSEEDVRIVEALADLAALAIDHARLVRRGREAAVLEERSRLARDLHDSVTQSIFSLGMMAQAAQTQHERGAPALAATLQRISSLAQQALTEMRALVFELRPAVLEEEGLAAALDRLAASFRARFDLPVSFTGEATLRLEPEAETAIFRIVQEALNNAVKHAHATKVAVILDQPESYRLIVTVRDNGVGFDAAAREPVGTPSGAGLGLRGMRERAAAAGLLLGVRSTPGKGATVRVEALAPTGAA